MGEEIVLLWWNKDFSFFKKTPKIQEIPLMLATWLGHFFGEPSWSDQLSIMSKCDFRPRAPAAPIAKPSVRRLEQAEPWESRAFGPAAAQAPPHQPSF